VAQYTATAGNSPAEPATSPGPSRPPSAAKPPQGRHLPAEQPTAKPVPSFDPQNAVNINAVQSLGLGQTFSFRQPCRVFQTRFDPGPVGYIAGNVGETPPSCRYLKPARPRALGNTTPGGYAGRRPDHQPLRAPPTVLQQAYSPLRQRTRGDREARQRTAGRKKQRRPSTLFTRNPLRGRGRRAGPDRWVRRWTGDLSPFYTGKHVSEFLQERPLFFHGLHARLHLVSWPVGHTALPDPTKSRGLRTGAARALDSRRPDRNIYYVPTYDGRNIHGSPIPARNQSAPFAGRNLRP